MLIKAKQSYVRSGQKKLGDVARAIKKMPVAAMRTELGRMNSEAARRILETLDQAVANAKHNFNVSEENLKLESLLILRGPHYKRFRAVSRGQGHAILKRTSHISITLKSVEQEVAKK
ncbi:MAG TPA: uL22 family ribosomal protein [Patescibacteria group bacterium]|nr:uL22 family ribosomal protein [Patescibacteria group bacterium]